MGHIRPILQILLLALFAGFILFSCSDSTDEIVPVEKRDIEWMDPVIFSEEIIPIFNQYCNYHCHSIAHSFYSLPPVLSPSLAYDELISGGYVDTIFHEQSLLYLKVEGTTAGIRMPPSGPLSNTEIQKILGWIKEGAPNN